MQLEKNRAHGVLVIDKPAGKTSRWATSLAARLLNTRKAGHLGTLDPLATGVLPVALGKATRIIRFLEKADKEYKALIELGTATDTQDRAGEVVFRGDVSSVDPSRVEAELAGMVGDLEQLPPMFSAVKKDGTPLYKLARKGLEIERKPRTVKIHSIRILSVDIPLVEISVTCGPGAYLRTMAHDLGQRLGCGAHLRSLQRLRSGGFTLESALNPLELSPETALQKLIPLIDCLPGMPLIEMEEEEAEMVADGMTVHAPPSRGARPGEHYRLARDGRLLAVALSGEGESGVVLKPLRVLV